MDFDDLDDATDARIADGDIEGIEGLQLIKKELSAFAGDKGLPPITRTSSLWTTEKLSTHPSFGTKLLDRQLRLRAFLFYGPGDKAEDYRDRVEEMVNKEAWCEFGIYEYPGHGAREDEACADDLDALVQDAFDALKPSLDEVKEGADCEGAPFAFIGYSTGCQLMYVLARKVLAVYGMSPCSFVAVARGAPEFAQLSEKGQELLDSDPEKVAKAFTFQNRIADKRKSFGTFDPKVFCNDMKIGCETRDNDYHKLDGDLLVIKSDKDPGIDDGSRDGCKWKLTTLQIKGTKSYFHMPYDDDSNLGDLLTCVSGIFCHKRTDAAYAVDAEGEELPGFTPIEPHMIIEGITDFKYPRYTWPHPIVIIGTGYHGLKLGMKYHVHHNYNVQYYDRLPEVGGYAWWVSATKFSRVQTDFGAFNIWWGQEYAMSGEGGWGSNTYGKDKDGNAVGRAQFSKAFKGPGSPEDGTVESGAGTGIDGNPVRLQVLAHMKFAAEEYGLEECIEHNCEVQTIECIGGQDDFARHYKIGVKHLGDIPFDDPSRMPQHSQKLVDNLQKHKKYVPEPDTFVKASIINHFPGAYDFNRIVTYPGEDKFGGQIGYGMGSGYGGLFKWDKTMKGQKAAILGNGAFAVENVRSCLEHGVSKIFLITRRRTLLCPRVPCWFCHMAYHPTPAGLLMKYMEPMYAMCPETDPKKDKETGMDPWTWYAVSANSKRTEVHMKQASRFGIGDVTFLAIAYGIFEYRETLLERCSKHTLHLGTGEKLEGVQHICKALGLLGDPRVDQMHAMTHRLGHWINSDTRRNINADATGMDFKRVSAFSAGPPAAQVSRMWYFYNNHPRELLDMFEDPDFLRNRKNITHKLSDTQPDNTIYMTNIAYEMYVGSVLAQALGKVTGYQYFTCFGDMKADEAAGYCVVTTMYPTKPFLEYCKADWDRYQTMFKNHNPGCEDKPWVPYPYSEATVKEWCEEWSERLKFQLDCAGPDDITKREYCRNFKDAMDSQDEWTISQFMSPKYSPIANCEAHENPCQEAVRQTTHDRKKELTITDEESSLEFTDEHYDAWKEYMAPTRKMTVEGAFQEGRLLLQDVAVWQKICGHFQSHAAVPEGDEPYDPKKKGEAGDTDMTEWEPAICRGA